MNNPQIPSQIVQELKFPQWINTLGIIPTQYQESMTYYETLVWFCNYLENTIIPTLNQNGKAVEELQKLFVNLNNYVNNYFENLDITTEINNKLDDLVQNGTLKELVDNYFNNLTEELTTELNSKLEEFNQQLEHQLNIIDNFIQQNSNITSNILTKLNNVENSTNQQVQHLADQISTGSDNMISENSISYKNLDMSLKDNYNFENSLIRGQNMRDLFISEKWGYGWNAVNPEATSRISLKVANMVNLANIRSIKIANFNSTYDIGVQIYQTQSLQTQIFDSGWLSNGMSVNVIPSNILNANWFKITIRNHDNTSIIETSIVNNIYDIYINFDYKVQYKYSDYDGLYAINNIMRDTHNLFVAHRGYSSIAPENTVPAFEEAGKAKFWRN